MKKIPFEYFLQYLTKEDYILVNRSEYINAKSMVNVICPKKHQYKTNYIRFVTLGNRCEICSIKAKNLSIEIVRERLVQRPEIAIDEATFINATTKARFIDKDFGEFWMSPTCVFLGKGHINSKHRVKVKLLQKKMIEKSIQVELVPKTYLGMKKKALFKDGEYEWWCQPNNVLRGSRHPTVRFNQSLLEMEELKRRVSEKLPFVKI